MVSATIQGNLLYKNTVTVLKRFFPKGKVDKRKIELIYTIPLNLKENKSGFNIVLSCKPLLVAIPINWLNEKFTKRDTERFELAKEVLEQLLERHNIEEADLFVDMVYSAVNGTELSERGRLKRRAGIYSREEFNLIVDDYFFKTQDEKIYSINWDRYFIFLDVTEEA